jgi:serine/threonine protein kinase
LIANEILLLASCRHKNIVNFLEAYIFKDRVWTVMEYCDGGTLTELYKGVELGVRAAWCCYN